MISRGTKLRYHDYGLGDNPETGIMSVGNKRMLLIMAVLIAVSAAVAFGPSLH
jgi:hypothetical protein